MCACAADQLRGNICLYFVDKSEPQGFAVERAAAFQQYTVNLLFAEVIHHSAQVYALAVGIRQGDDTNAGFLQRCGAVRLCVCTENPSRNVLCGAHKLTVQRCAQLAVADHDGSDRRPPSMRQVSMRIVREHGADADHDAAGSRLRVSCT